MSPGEQLLGVIVTGLALNQLIEVFRHSDMPAIARRRARWELLDPQQTWRGGWAHCPWCASIAAGFVMILLWQVDWLRLLPCALAASRIANLVNDVTYPYLRTPNRHE